MELVRLLLVFAHLLGMAVLVAAFLLQRRTAPDGPLAASWLHGAALQLVTGLALVGIDPLTGQDYDPIKMAAKLVVLLVITGLALGYRARRPMPRRLPAILGGLVILNIALAVFWT